MTHFRETERWYNVGGVLTTSRFFLIFSFMFFFFLVELGGRLTCVVWDRVRTQLTVTFRRRLLDLGFCEHAAIFLRSEPVPLQNFLIASATYT